MNTKNKETFIQNIRTYFKDDADKFLVLLNEEPKSAFFLNETKADIEKIFSIIDFKYEKSLLNPKSYYYFDTSIGKSKAYELGLIYPQDVESSLPCSFIDTNNIKYAIDLCSAPGGKSINILNRLNEDALLISNDINYKRANILSNNLERLGLNPIVTSNKIDYFTTNFKNVFDLVILDVPCSGEGIIRKYPEIIDEYSNANIDTLAYKQSVLLQQAYELLNNDAYLLYSTCTYSFKEDEEQIKNFLNKYEDMELIELPLINKHSQLKGTIKLSILDNTEGQFMALLHKKGNKENIKLKYNKPINNETVDKFIKDNLDIKDYYLYHKEEKYYLSFKPLIDIDNYLSYGIYLGNLENKIFKPAHSMYRSNLLIDKYKYTYDLSDKEYADYISGKELKIDKEDHYYLLTYKDLSLGYGKLSNGILKNKYPKGLRRVV